MQSKIVIPDKCGGESSLARLCAELVRQGVTFEVHHMSGSIGGQWWEVTFTGGY